MKVKSIEIINYRSVKSLNLELTQKTALIGANNAGKSNILLAIFKVLGKEWITVNTFDEDERNNGDPDSDIKITVEFEEPLKYVQYKGFDPFEIYKLVFLYTHYKIGESKGAPRLEKACIGKNGKPVNIFKERPTAGKQAGFVPLNTIPNEVIESIPIIYIGSDRQLRYQLPSSRNSILGSLMSDIDKGFKDKANMMTIKNSQGVTSEVSRIDRFNLCMKEAIRALKTDEYQKLEATIQENVCNQLGIEDKENLKIYFNPTDSIDFYKTLGLFVEENDFTINALNLGGGYQNAIVLSIMKAFEEMKKSGAIFLIEEPEMFLHPQLQRSLYKTLDKISVSNQVIYTTHSPHFLSTSKFDEINIISKDDEGTHVKKSTILGKDQKELQRLKDKFNKEFFNHHNELFFAKRVLLVEGPTENLAINAYANKLNTDFDSKGGTIIDVGGKGNLLDYIELVKSFEIDCAVLYDTDSKEFKDKRDKEQEINSEIDKSGVKIWKSDKNYEEELKKLFGDAKYLELCEKYGQNKVLRARLIAEDESLEIPKFAEEIIKWLNGEDK